MPATARTRLPSLAPLLLAVALAALLLAGCGGDSGDEPVPETVSSKPLRVGASPVPHGEILRFVKDELAPGTGLNLEIAEYTDYVLPNQDLEKGELDANYFQIPAFLEQTAKADDIDLVEVVGVHIEPLGLYSSSVRSVDAIPAGATVAIPEGTVTGTRSLRLLAANGLISLRDPQAETITTKDITENPKRLEIEGVEASATPRALDDHTLAVINGNYALEAGLKPAKDAIASEQVAGNPNVNLLATLGKNEDDPRIRKLAELLTSPQVKQFIEERYQGAVVPVF